MMFERAEIKHFVIAWGRRWFFPEFNNKLTWLVVGSGVGIVLMPDPIELLLFNWVVETINKNWGTSLSMARLMDGAAGPVTGTVLVVSGLLNNVLVRAINGFKDWTSQQARQEAARQDDELFGRFLALLPSDGKAVQLLKEHDFSNSYSGDALHSLEAFVHKWGGAEYKFRDSRLEKLREEFFQKSQLLLSKLAQYGGPVFGSASRYRIVPDKYADDWEWPSYVQDQIRELNTLGSEIFNLHQELVMAGRKVRFSPL